MPRTDPEARKADAAYRTLEDSRGRQLYRMAMWWREGNYDKDMLSYIKAALNEWRIQDREANRPRPKYPEREIELSSGTVLARIWASKEAADKADRGMRWAYGCRPKNM